MSVQKNSQTRKQQMQEIEYQKKMLSNLKKWMRNLIVLSSVGIVIAYWAMHLMNGWVFRFIGGAGIVFAVICVILCMIIGLAWKRGKANVEKIIKIISVDSFRVDSFRVDSFR